MLEYNPLCARPSDKGFATAPPVVLTSNETRLLGEFRDRLSREGFHGYDDVFLLRFLMAKKWAMDRAIVGFHEYDHANHTFGYSGLRCLKVEDALRDAQVLFPGTRDEHGAEIICINVENTCKNGFDEVEFMKVLVYQMNLALLFERTMRCGFCLVLDLANMDMSTLPDGRAYEWLLAHLQNKFPARIRGIYLVNANGTINAFYSVSKHFMNKKLRGKIVFVPSTEHLRNILPEKSLPVEYGGTFKYDLHGFIEHRLDVEARHIYRMRQRATYNGTNNNNNNNNNRNNGVFDGVRVTQRVRVDLDSMHDDVGPS